MKAKRYIITIAILFLATAAPINKASATPLAIIEVIKAGVKKVIKAMDLKIQRLQNKTIWMQNAQKVLENEMSKLKLNEITDWVERQRKLYDEYYQDLWKVRNTIATYKRVREIMENQIAILNEYKTAYSALKSDKNFSKYEMEGITTIYNGILNESVKNLDEALLVINSFSTQMSDAKRLEIICHVADKMDNNLGELRQFNKQNISISYQRARERHDIATVKKLYGL